MQLDNINKLIRFNNDYSEGAHPVIMQKLNATNMVQSAGYGEDQYSEEARTLIKNVFNCPKSAVHFLVGGTQANLTVISAALRPHQSVICAETGHINVHETGAIEACGHKVEALPHTDGKIDADLIDTYVQKHFDDESFEHITQPKMVYISNPTEYGTLYSYDELSAIKKVCEKHELFLFIDGARLGYGLSCPENDIPIDKYSYLSDVFTVGGTKVGALFGEAVVIQNKSLQKDFRYIIKQKGGMLAKGRLLGIQFLGLFEENLYFQLGKHANLMAGRIKIALNHCGAKPFVNSPTNQLFYILHHEVLKKIAEKFTFSTIGHIDDQYTIVRFCTSWATKEDDVKSFEDFLSSL